MKIKNVYGIFHLCCMYPEAANKGYSINHLATKLIRQAAMSH